ncbi:MAG: hypothetical protein R2788_10665 [Saprospiraceae bacterium]
MEKNISKLILLIIPILFTSCFEIREEVNMKADGSGEVMVVFDLSKSKGKLKQYMKMEKVENYRVPSEPEIETYLLTIKNTIRGVSGINYTETKSDWSNFIFNVTARFDNIDALNKAILRIADQLKNMDIPPIMEANFKYEKNRFNRLFDYPPKPQEFAQLPSMQRFMLESSNAISIYRFEKKVRDVSHEKAMVSPSGKAVMLKVSLADLVTGKGTLANSISFEN